jgi:hypothetical protein
VAEEKIGFKDNKSPLQEQSGLVKFENFGVHYLNGSEWMPVDLQVREEKKELLLETINEILSKNL